MKIKNYDKTSFKLFLDCLIGFQNCTTTDVFLIFPIAWTFEAEELIKKCIEVLTPTVLNENVCLALNMSLSCKCEELSKIEFDFLLKKKLLYKVLDDEKLCFLLELEAMELMLEHVEMDSYILQNVLKWGEQYLKKNNKRGGLRNFFTQQLLISYLDISLFETTKAFLEFDESRLGKKFYTDKEVRKWVLEKEPDTRKCGWFLIKAGESLVEKIKIENVGYRSDCQIICNFFQNPVIFHEFPEDETKMFCFNYSLNFADSRSEVITKSILAGPKHIFKRHVFSSKINIDRKKNGVSDLEVEIKYTFYFDCRILKKSSRCFIPMDNDKHNLYFTRIVTIKLEKKK